mmetsp:Transcript_89113/g.195211  ORF Transcript_89113/g.195211 Transcript_89113/m.195211 type:complete len:1031 (+) Transcript_89113:136-3228(+)|eukprot:CAMPEP_0206541914 /NCGR_PEP_ID=MMETSP0325_2-20121206/9881_1 /ASSEMBLY_ACC=CAM_ASM_000347 /TAXON_ID=2866 /ORGANISM="Crypthecodinium cohnii, Strain Seligo" /LENGTH=1030 /DNA_ID=CAMNT_0054039913 /DNA_START=70 /DNA_END=3162 /DNA_ORIENTATION=-
MSIPWMPREVSSRLYEKEHELENVRTTYLMSTAFVGAFLAREDGRRPSWFNRVKLMPVSTLTPDLQEHLSNTCHVVCMKTRQEVMSEPTKKGPVPEGRPTTGWQAGILCGRVLWRTLFTAAASKANINRNGSPVLYMAACQSLLATCRSLLTQIWLEVQLQFTSKISKYRNIKSRPAWSVLEGLQYKGFCLTNGFGLFDPEKVAPSSAGSKPASDLQDYLEEVLALRFAIDMLSLAMKDGEEFIDMQTKRLMRKAVPKQRLPGNAVEAELMALKQKTIDSFGMMWTDDAEIRGIASLSARLMDGLEGPSAVHFAATFTAQILLAMWKGAQPLLSQRAALGISRIAETHAVLGSLPPPPLEDADNEQSETAVFDRIALSYGPPSKDCRELVSALPRGVLGCVIKAQAVFRGFLLRSRYFRRMRAVAAYCKAARWPQLLAPLEGYDEPEESLDAKKDKRRLKKKPKKVDATKLKEEIQDYQPAVSKYLGGESTKGSAVGATQTAWRGGGTAAGSTADMNPERRPWPLPTADHRACSDLFALYMYNMYRRRELTQMWCTLCGAYERGMDNYAELLNKNPALKPMLESIAAQLKRGSVVGYDKAFIAKQRKDTEGPAGAGRNPGADMFASNRTKPAQGKQDTSTMRPLGLAPLPKDAGQGEGQQDMTGEYLANYLKEMDGDDSQFKDISASVLPLSTGTSPARKPPHEYIIQQEVAARQASPRQAAGMPSDPAEAAKKIKPDVPFCMKKVKPMWLPIKAHRFAAYRAKVLHLLPQRVLQQYVDFEKQGQYAACVKLLESATPGSLNVLSPSTLVSNKPLLVETVFQLIVGYSGLCLKNNQGNVAVKLITQVLDSMSLALRDLHPGHRTVLEAYLYDTALSIAYYMPNDISLSERAESFFQQASERYLRLEHTNRYCKCCLRAAAVLHQQGHLSEAEYYTQQALNKLADAPVSSLLVVCYHNLAVHTLVQQRLADSVAHVRAYVALLRQLPKLGNAWMQQVDNTQWLILKSQEMWPQFQQMQGIRDSQAVTKFGH